MASASSLAHFNSADAERGFETIEVDPQYAQSLGLAQGDTVRKLLFCACRMAVDASIGRYWSCL